MSTYIENPFARRTPETVYFHPSVRQNRLYQPAGNHDFQVTSGAREYTLKIVQEATGARTCGLGDKDRRYLNPTPLVKIEVRDRLTGKEVDIQNEKPNNLILRVELWNEDGSAQCNILHVTDHKKLFAGSATLVGVGPVTADAVITAQPVASTPPDDVASAVSRKASSDEALKVPRTSHNNLVGNTFFTPEFITKGTKTRERGIWCEIKQLSIRMRGKYRLYFQLFDLSNALEAGQYDHPACQPRPYLAAAFSEVICVQVPRDIVREGSTTKKRSGPCTQVPESSAKRQKTQPTPKSNAKKQRKLKGKEGAAPVQVTPAAEDNPIPKESVSPVVRCNPNVDVILPTGAYVTVDPSLVVLNPFFNRSNAQGTVTQTTEGYTYDSLTGQSSLDFDRILPSSTPVEVNHFFKTQDQSHWRSDVQGTAALPTSEYTYDRLTDQSNPNFDEIIPTTVPAEVDHSLTALDQTNWHFDVQDTAAQPTEEYAHGSDLNEGYLEDSIVSIEGYAHVSDSEDFTVSTEEYANGSDSNESYSEDSNFSIEGYFHVWDFDNKRHSEDSTDFSEGYANSSELNEPWGQEELKLYNIVRQYVQGGLTTLTQVTAPSRQLKLVFPSKNSLAQLPEICLGTLATQVT